MKKFTKLLGIVLIMALVMSISVSAFAATVTINRDSTWDENAENAEATYTYYKIFDAKDIDQEVDPATGEQTADSAGVAVYWVDSLAKAQALPALFLVNNKAPSAVTAADAADDGYFYVTLASDSTSAADIAAALKTMVEANTTLFPGTDVTSDENPVVIDSLDDGYYLIKASNGSVLAVQTLDDVEINEKNDYPKVDKQQKKANGTWTDDPLPAELGTYIDYQVTVHVPANANKDIAVVDVMSAGLEWDEDFGTNGLTVTPAVAYTELSSTDEGYNANATWQIKFAPADYANYKGQDIVITYRAKVTEDALTDSDKENEVTLTYDEGNYVLTDTVDYEIYFGGIYKIDPNDSDANMAGVKFDLKDGDGNAVNVTYKDGYYVVDPESTSNEVETRADGTNYTIKIRGLDNDKTYTLTETETKTGYNLLNGTVTLTKIKDDGTAFADKVANTYDRVENNKGTVLPSTGGIGTTIFYVVGSILVVAAGVLLITKKRMSREG